MRRIGIKPGPKLFGFAVVLGLLGLFPAMARADTESYDAIFLGGARVGYMKIGVEPVKDGDRLLRRVRVNIVLTIQRAKNASTIVLEYGTIETPEGKVLRLDTQTFASQTIIRVHGDVNDGKMRLQIESGAQKQEAVIPWTDDTFGPYGAELSLSRKPLAPGESRKIKTFIPDLNKVAETTLTARAPEPVVLGDGGQSRELLRVDQEIAVEGGKKMPEMDTTLWVDAKGQVLKSFTASNGGMTSFRTTKEAALRPAEKFDLLAASIVKLVRPIAEPEKTRNVVYRVLLSEINPVDVFPNDRRQAVKAGENTNTATLEVKSAGPESGEAGPESVGPEFLRPNPLINSEDARIVAMARLAVTAAKAADPWAKAQAINKWVYRNMKNKNFETSFAPADEVARTLSGDCTEHAVLTAAMCRSQGIPARVATGLIYATNLGGFGFHMWNEVYVNRRWVAIDSAFDQTQVDGVHIKLTDTSLDGVAPFETFLPVARIQGKLKLEVVETR